MSILADMAQPVTHPAWCSPLHCDGTVTPRDTRHSGVPALIQAAEDDVEVTVALVRDDELTGDGRQLPGPFGVTLQLRNTESLQLNGAPIGADVLLTPDEADRLAADLVAYAAHARDELRRQR